MNLIVNAGRRGDSTKSRLAAHNIVVHAPCRPGRGSDATRPRATEHRGRCLVDLPATQREAIKAYRNLLAAIRLS
jgi:hypothetical protein